MFRTGSRSLHRSAAALVFVPALLVSLYFARSNISVIPYKLSHQAAANATLPIMAPYLAFSASIEMGVVRSFWLRFLIKRRSLAVIVDRLRLPIGLGLFGQLLVFSYFDALPSEDNLRYFYYPILNSASVIVWAIFGAAIGLTVRRVFAIPISIVLPFLVLTLPQAWSILWLRHLNGYLFDCCSTSNILSKAAVESSLGFLLFVLCLSGSIVVVRLAGVTNLRRNLLLVFATLIAAVVVSTMLVAPARKLGPLPISARPIAELQCFDSVCLWPEDENNRRMNSVAWMHVEREWTSLNLPLRATTIAPETSSSALGLTTSGLSLPDTILSMSLALPRSLVRCDTDYTNSRRNAQLDQMAALLLRTEGLADEVANSGLPESPISPSAARLMWPTIRVC